jgi:hypothetical protein
MAWKNCLIGWTPASFDGAPTTTFHSHVYRNAHTHCPIGGERLESIFAKYRENGGVPVEPPDQFPWDVWSM